MLRTKTKSGYSVNIPFSFDHFRFIRTLGFGSSSVVCLVEEEETNEKYTAKIIPKSYLKKRKLVKQIEKEIAILQEIDHPNIIKIYKAFELTNKFKEPYVIIITEYCKNGDLLHYALKKGFHDEIEKQKIIHGFLEALKYLHNRGIAHGDIKPENVLLDSNFEAKLADFGYCKTKLIAGDDEKSGTLFYAAPEMFTNGEFDTIKSDIWSIGITLFCISEKKFPYFCGSEKYVRKQITTGRLLIDPKVNKTLRNIVKKCTEFKPETRPSIEELMEDEYFSSYKRMSNNIIFIDFSDYSNDC